MVKNDRLLDEEDELNGSLLDLAPPNVCDLALPLLDVKKRAPDPPNSDRALADRAPCEPAEKVRLKLPPNARLPPLYMLIRSVGNVFFDLAVPTPELFLFFFWVDKKQINKQLLPHKRVGRGQPRQALRRGSWVASSEDPAGGCCCCCC